MNDATQGDTRTCFCFPRENYYSYRLTPYDLYLRSLQARTDSATSDGSKTAPSFPMFGQRSSNTASGDLSVGMDLYLYTTTGNKYTSPTVNERHCTHKTYSTTMLDILDNYPLSWSVAALLGVIFLGVKYIRSPTHQVCSCCFHVLLSC